jgi:excisionase family DNA binding protein
MENILTAEQAARELDYSKDHLYRLIKKGIVRGQKFGRDWMIDRQEVERVKTLQGKGGRLPKLT